MQAVLVTGAAGGVGMATIASCAQKGYRVYAGAIDDWEICEIERLKSEIPAGENIHSVMLDLRKQDQIDAVVERLESEDPSWFGLVANGAACPTAIPFEHLDISDTTRDVFESNVFGNLELIQRFLPLLMKTEGRVVLVSSLFGKTGEGMLLSYASSKHACEGFCTVLRRELKPFGIKVVLTNPGVIKETYMMHNHHTQAKKLLAKIRNCRPEEITTKSFDPGKNTALRQPELVADEKYLPNYLGMMKMLEGGLMSPLSVTPEGCAKHIMKGLQAKNPRVRYISGWDARILIFLTRVLPESWGDKIAEVIASANSKEAGT